MKGRQGIDLHCHVRGRSTSLRYWLRAVCIGHFLVLIQGIQLLGMSAMVSRLLATYRKR